MKNKSEAANFTKTVLAGGMKDVDIEVDGDLVRITQENDEGTGQDEIAIPVLYLFRLRNALDAVPIPKD